MPRYERISFDRDLATRTGNCEIGGIGHPLVDALIKQVRKPEFQGSVYGDKNVKKICAHYLVQRRDEKEYLKGRLFSLYYDLQKRGVHSRHRFDPPMKQDADGHPIDLDFDKAKESIEADLQQEIITWLPERQARAGLQISLVGLHSE